MLFHSIRDAVERGYVPRIVPVVVTRPRILALYDEDIVDALKFNGLLEKEPDLESVQAAKDCPMPSHPTAVAAASGFCERSDGWARLHDRGTILSVLYARQALQVQQETLTDAQCDWVASEREDNSILSWELGRDGLEILGAEKYWIQVRELLLELPTKTDLRKRPITKVILHGESADATDFVKVVKNVVTQLRQDEDPDLLCDNPTFGAARGAMTLAMQERNDYSATRDLES